MKGTCEQIPFHFFLKFMMLSRAGDTDFENKKNPGWNSIVRNVRCFPVFSCTYPGGGITDDFHYSGSSNVP